MKFYKIVILILITHLVLFSDVINNHSNTETSQVFTSVGELGLTIQNFGVLGEGWNTPNVPSCRYNQYAIDLHKEIEHFSYAGVWIGGQIKGENRVSTAILDGVFDYAQEGFEFSIDNSKIEDFLIRSKNDTSEYYSPNAISDQDFVCDYNDFSDINEHKPLGIRVRQSSYAWEQNSIDNFVIIRYTIYNESNKIDNSGIGWDISNIYLGLWVDASIANMNLTSVYEPGGGFTWYDNVNSFDTSSYYLNADNDYKLSRNIAYQYDVDGDGGYAESYIGVRILGSDYQSRESWSTYYNQWIWSTSSNADYPDFIMPDTDSKRYKLMKQSVQTHPGEDGYTDEGYPENGDGWIMLISAGPFGKTENNLVLAPGDSVSISLAVSCAFWSTNNTEDTPARKATLYESTDLAQKIYNGEDKNGNGILDTGEDFNDDGKIDRYIAPPSVPENLTADWNYPNIKLTWECSDENAIGFNVYKLDSLKNYSKINDDNINENSYAVVTADSGNNCFYVTALNEYLLESPPSEKIKDHSTAPTIEFTNLPNYKSKQSKSDTSFSFDTRTFQWSVEDIDGANTISNIFYALDDTTNWLTLESSMTNITLMDLEAGEHIFYLKAKDNSDLYSSTISFPPDKKYSPEKWIVNTPIGNTLLIDNCYSKSSISSRFKAILEDSLDITEYTHWSIDDSYNSFPTDSMDVKSLFSNFKNILWLSEFLSNDNLENAKDHLTNFISSGGNVFIEIANQITVEPNTFPTIDGVSLIDSLGTVNKSARIFTGTKLLEQKENFPELITSQVIGYFLYSIIPTDSSDILYQFEEGSEQYDGKPIVGLYRKNYGKLSIFTVPLHYIDGKYSTLFNELLDIDPTDIDFQKQNFPQEFSLENCYPNPFNPSTTIKYRIPKKTHVNISVYNMRGELVTTLVNTEKKIGNYKLKWEASNLPSGIYFYKLKTKNFVKTKKMLLLK